MFRNLVIISLDAVSQSLFWQFREAMPTLWNLSLRSSMFRRFYSSSTSALQSFSDFVHGDSAELDHLSSWPEGAVRRAGRSENLFGTLHDRGMATLGIMHGNPIPAYAPHHFWGLWPERCGSFECCGDYKDFDRATDGFLTKCKTEGKPFALYYCDRAARPDDASPEKQEAALFHERFEKGYALLDRSAKRLLDRLRDLQLLGETAVVVYGAYGMDPWKHGLYRGRTTAIAPYADVCWTPFFIYMNEADVKTVDLLVGTVDLKPTLLHMFHPDWKPAKLSNSSSGLNIFHGSRSIAFTQNLFAFEREVEGFTLGLSKSYAATDGEFRLLVTSDGGIPGEGGMELYFDPRDAGNTRNFLDFFNLSSDGDIESFGHGDIVHVHFIQSFKRNLVMEMVKSYGHLRNQLYHFIKRKESMAKPLNDGNGMLFPNGVFSRKRRRQ